MDKLTRRDFLVTASAATLTAAAAPSLAATTAPATGRQRVFVGSGTPEGILAYDWNPATGELTPAGVAALLASVAWIAYSSDRQYLFATSDQRSFNGLLDTMPALAHKLLMAMAQRLREANAKAFT